MSTETVRTDDEAFRKAAKKGPSIGFSDEDGIETGFIKTGEINGRETSVTTDEGEKKLKAKVTIVRTPGGIIATFPGVESQIISMNIDKAGKLLPENLIEEIKNDLGKDRKRRKENIGAR